MTASTTTGQHEWRSFSTADDIWTHTDSAAHGYVGGPHGAHQRFHELEDRVRELETQLAAAEQRATLAEARATNEHAFGRQSALDDIREWVLENQSRYSLCDQGVGDFFEAFGMAPKTREYSCRIERTVTEVAYITVEATDIDAAWDEAREQIRYGDAADYASWERGDIGSADVEDVDEA